MYSPVCHSPARYKQYMHQTRWRPSRRRFRRWCNTVTLFVFDPRFAAFKHYKPEWILTSHRIKKWMTKNATLPLSEFIVKSLGKTVSNCILYFEIISPLILKAEKKPAAQQYTWLYMIINVMIYSLCPESSETERIAGKTGISGQFCFKQETHDLYKGVLQYLRDSIRHRRPELSITGKWFLLHDNVLPQTAIIRQTIFTVHQIAYTNWNWKMLWHGSECGRNKGNENLKTTIPSNNYDRTKTPGKCGMF